MEYEIGIRLDALENAVNGIVSVLQEKNILPVDKPETRQKEK